MKWLPLVTLVALGALTPVAVWAEDEDEGRDDESSEVDEESEDEDSEADEDSDEDSDEADDEDGDRPKKKKKKRKKKDRDEDDEESDEDDEESEEEEPYGHMGQFFVRAGLVLGYRMVFRYDDSPYCADPRDNDDDDERKLCGFMGPLALELAGGFAPSDGVEPFLWARFGFSTEKDTDTLPLVIVGAGARLYTMADSAFKVFIEPAFGVELEKGGDNPVWQAGDKDYRTDLVVHLAAGPQFDVAENFGLYLDGGLTVGMIRAIHSTMELQFGVQGRLP